MYRGVNKVLDREKGMASVEALARIVSMKLLQTMKSISDLGSRQALSLPMAKRIIESRCPIKIPNMKA